MHFSFGVFASWTTKTFRFTSCHISRHQTQTVGIDSATQWRWPSITGSTLEPGCSGKSPRRDVLNLSPILRTPFPIGLGKGSGRTLCRSLRYCDHIHRHRFSRQANAFYLRLRGGGWALGIEKLEAKVVELVARFVVGDVVGRFREMLQVAAGLLQNPSKRAEDLANLT